MTLHDMTFGGLRNSEDTKLIRNSPNLTLMRCNAQSGVLMYTGLESLQQFRNASPSGTISFSPLPSAGSPAHPKWHLYSTPLNPYEHLES